MQGGWHETLWQVKYMQIKLNPLKSCHTFSYGFSGGDSIGILIAQPAAIAISALLFLLPGILVLPTLHQPCRATVPSFLHLISSQHNTNPATRLSLHLLFEMFINYLQNNLLQL